MVRFTVGDGFLLGNFYDEDVETFTKGYLLAYDFDREEYGYICDDALYPLLAGEWLSYFSNTTASRHVWNLNTGEDIDLGVYAQYVVSNGSKLYYWVDKSNGISLHEWDEEGEKEILFVEGENVNISYTYLTPDMLYWLQQTVGEDKITMEFYYLNPATGEMGLLYGE